MVFLSKLKHDQGRESAHQNWGILFPMILLIGWNIITGGILVEFPAFLVYLTKVSPFFEERLTKISPKYILQVGDYLIPLVINILLIMIIRYILRVKYDTVLKKIGLSFYNLKKYLIFGSLIGIIESTVVTIPILMIWPEYAENFFEKKMALWQGPSLFLAYFGAVVIVGPLSEEILFRGLFFSALRKYINLFWAILISACLFSLLHFHFLFSIISSFFSAVLLCFLYEKTRSLMLCITIHAVGNVFNNLYFILFSFII